MASNLHEFFDIFMPKFTLNSLMEIIIDDYTDYNLFHIF